MKFLIHCTIEPKNRNESMRRLKEYGTQAPEGVKILSLWHGLDNLEGWVIVEADSEFIVAQWLLSWTDLNLNRVVPVLDKKELDKLLEISNF